MKSPFYFIVEPLNGYRYDNVKTIGDKEMLLSNDFEDYKTTNRFAKVLETPNNYKGGIKIGDILVVHHNVFRIQLDMKGREVSGRSFLKDNTFFVDETQFFAYKNDKGWNCFDKYCFVKPLSYEEQEIYTSLNEQPLTGEIFIINQELLDLGVKPKDKVIFEPNSEYAFNIEGEKVYRMFTKNITAVL